MDFTDLASRAAQVRRRYSRWEETRYGRPWTPEEIALGFVGDIGDLMKLVQGKAGVRPRADLDEALAHELADCLWAVLTLADTYGVDLERAFLSTMDDLDRSLDPDARERPVPPRVRIVHLSGPTLDALAAGDLAAASASAPVALSEYTAGPDWRGVWRYRSRQVADDPTSAAWVTGLVRDEDLGIVVGRAGYHGPPDAAGMVEIGYAIDPAYRRRGYARAALEQLLGRAAAEPSVRTVRVTISPDNAPSLALTAQYGFVEVGEQWDDEDGLEIVYERDARPVD
jgi:RimJ/RimL family protein N-acetyltransferase